MNFRSYDLVLSFLILDREEVRGKQTPHYKSWNAVFHSVIHRRIRIAGDDAGARSARRAPAFAVVAHRLAEPSALRAVHQRAERVARQPHELAVVPRLEVDVEIGRASGRGR